MERIQELTEKIRLEGVEKGKAEAEEIIAKARAEAAQIVSTAKEQADAIMQQAKKANSELETNTKSELKLYLAQAINALKSEVTNVVTDRIVGSAVADMAADKDFLGQFAVALAKQWTKNEDIVISTPEAETLKAYFAKQGPARQGCDHREDQRPAGDVLSESRRRLLPCGFRQGRV